MFEKFENNGIFEKFERVEKLEEGVYLEHVFSEQETELEDGTEALVFGDDKENPSCSWWNEFAKWYELQKEGLQDQDDTIESKNFLQFFESQNWFAQFEEDLTLEDLISKLTDDDQILCMVNHLVLEHPEISEISGFSANDISWLSGIDLSDFGNEKVFLYTGGLADGVPADGVLADGVPADGVPADGVPADSKQGHREYSLEAFLKSWKLGGNRAFTISKG